MNGLLKSYKFRRERERTWRGLEDLVAKVEKSGIRSLSAAESHRLPVLYRATLSSLSVARGISLDRNVLNFLESLSARAYFCVYGPRGSLSGAIADFFQTGFPTAVWAARWHMLAATSVFFLGVVVGFILVAAEPEWFYTFVPEGLADGRVPTSTTAELKAALYETDVSTRENLHVFASFLFTHNARIGMMAFALGIALGIPVVLLVMQNGTIIGAMAALYHGRGLSADFWAWLLIHGTTELLAIILCAGAGLVLGTAVALPGPYTRLENLARRGRLAGRIVVGAVFMFLVAGFLEGFGRQLITDMTVRYIVAAAALAAWLVYFAVLGRNRHGGEGA